MQVTLYARMYSIVTVIVY